MGIFGELACEQGATVGTLLAVRFALAAALFWLLVLATGTARQPRELRRGDALLGLALGAFGYSAQAGCYSAALKRLDASLLSLLALHVPRARHRGGDPAGPRALQPPGGRRARPGPCWCWPARPPERWTR